MSFCCLNGSAPSYLSNLLTPYSPAHDLRSSEKNLLATKPYRLAQYGKRVFSRATPLLWNSLPDPIRQVPRPQHVSLTFVSSTVFQRTRLVVQ
jgi:hypothetical protein